MPTLVVSVSSLLLLVLLTVRHFEQLRGNGRTFELGRTKLDRVTYKTFFACKRRVSQVVEFIQKDIFLYVLHLVMSLALMLVRFVEKRLERVTVFIRSFRKKRAKKSTSENLRAITREERIHSQDEQSL